MITSKTVTVDLVDAMAMAIAIHEYMNMLVLAPDLCWGEKSESLCALMGRLDDKIVDAMRVGDDAHGEKSDH